jgi:LAO/AO transport system kinase
MPRSVRPQKDAAAIVDRIAAGNRRALAQAITAIESASPGATALIKEAFPRAAAAPVVGITGPSGSGKSTLVDCLTATFRAEGVSVGVLAVDPTSPFTGGALLGDRVRMQRHSEDPGVYVRSMATRGAMGGLAAAVYDTLILLSVAGLERLLLETVGAGQDEVDVAGVADTTCVVLTPVGGDDIQAIKAGIMEIAEGKGIEELRAAIGKHEAWYRSSGKAEDKRKALAGVRLRTLLRERLLAAARLRGFDAERERQIVEEIAAGRLDPHSAAQRVVEEVLAP